MNIAKLSDAGAAATVGEICAGLAQFVGDNPELAKELLKSLVPMLEKLSQYDFFGTEGWKHGLGVDL